MITRHAFLPGRIFAQQDGKVRRIGTLATDLGADYSAIVRGMRDLGYLEGKNFVIDYRTEDPERLAAPERIAYLVAHLVDPNHRVNRNSKRGTSPGTHAT